MSEEQNFSKTETLEELNLSKTEIATMQTIETLLKIPVVKVDRDVFLLTIFTKKEQSLKERIQREGPVKAGIGREELLQLARNVVFNDTLKSTSMSFVAGMPGGLALPLTITADTAQFFGMALHLAQKIAYLYGEENLWVDGNLNSERVSKSFVLYCGVMLGASGSSAALRILSSQFGKEVAKRLPNLALTKTFYYPIIKSIVKYFGVKLTKESFAKAIGKVIPVIGGVVSAGITFISMRPMGFRLVDTLDEAKFHYTEEELDADLVEIKATIEDLEKHEVEEEQTPQTSIADEIQKNKDLFDAGILTEEEFNEIKRKLIEKL